MSTYYSLYTEIKIDDKWYCINHEIKDISSNENILSATYWSSSRSYFGETYYKLENIGKPIRNKNLSKELQKIFGEEDNYKYYIQPIEVYLKDMEKCVPKKKIHEHHGYVDKNILASYKLGDVDDIYDWLSISEYKKLNREEKKMYSYYEWDNSQGWLKYFKEILEHVKWQLYEWSDINYRNELSDIRIIVFAD